MQFSIKSVAAAAFLLLQTATSAPAEAEVEAVARIKWQPLSLRFYRFRDDHCGEVSDSRAGAASPMLAASFYPTREGLSTCLCCLSHVRASSLTVLQQIPSFDVINAGKCLNFDKPFQSSKVEINPEIVDNKHSWLEYGWCQ